MASGAGRPAAGGGRWIEVAPERIAGWLDRYFARHGGAARSSYGPDGAGVFEAADGSVATCLLAFPPSRTSSDYGPSGYGPLVEAACAERLVGVLLVRLGGHAAGIFAGPRLEVSKVGSRQVHGRSAAGGWSQQRFARRREGQVRVAAESAADAAAHVLLPRLGELDGVVLGGERRAMDALREDPRLAPVFALASERFLTVPDPKLAVLKEAGAAYRAVHVRLVESEMT